MLRIGRCRTELSIKRWEMITATPLDLYTNHFKLVAPYNSSNDSSDNWSYKSSFTPPLYIFNYATGVLALLSNTSGVDVSCDTGGTCGYDPKVYKTVAIADPSLAPYGVAAQSVLIGRYGLEPPTLETRSEELGRTIALETATLCELKRGPKRV